MKKILILTFIGLLIGYTAEAQVKWKTIEQAAKTDNSKSRKLYFIDFYTDWCGWCKRMDSETFADPTVAKIPNTYYTPVKFNAEGSETFEWNGKQYKGTPAPRGARPSTHPFVRSVLGSKIGYPSFAVFNSSKGLMTVLPGYRSAKDFTIILWYFASGDCDRYPFEQYQKIFDSQIRPTMNKKLNTK